MNAYDRSIGAGTSELLGTVSGEIFVGVLTGGASQASKLGKAAAIVDTLSNGYQVGSGIQDIHQNGLTWQNSVQVASSALGVAGNLSGAARSLDEVAEAAARSARAPGRAGGAVACAGGLTTSSTGGNSPCEVVGGVVDAARSGDDFVESVVDVTPNKRGPKTDPNAPHNATIRTQGDLLEAGGNTILNGGGKFKETLIDTTGGLKSGRRPDIIFQIPNGQIRGRNIGLTDLLGNPVKREREALADLNSFGIPTDFVPYD